jgi:pectate lyase
MIGFERNSRGKWMFSSKLKIALASVVSIGFPLCLLAAAAAPGPDAGRDVLETDDGWASVPGATLPLGTTGGSNAAAGRTHTVTNRAELIAALRYPDPTPKLIYVKGSIDANVDDNGMPQSCKDYVRPDPFTGELFNIFAFTATFDPAGPWGKRAPFGGQENARAASAAAQEKRIHIRVPPNTTIYGQGADAALVGAWLDIGPESTSGSQPMNVIVRNLSLEDTTDCFPEWSPDDGVTGNWNSRYDAISIRNATHVWIDRNRFADARTRDATQPSYFGRLYQVHDGLVDVTDESDFVTVSWNHFTTHDKAMLIGNSDGAVADRNKLHVTIHHNLFENLGQRAPRVRFGQVHIYNNLYKVDRNTNYHSTWGVGVESQIYAENNFFEFSPMYGPMEVIDGKKGSQITTVGNCWQETGQCVPTDFLAEWNAKFDPDLKADVGWKPKLYGPASAAESTESARERVLKESGPGRTGTQ